jgi:hypothetical protein
MIKPAAGYRPLAYPSPEAVQTTGTVALLLFAKYGIAVDPTPSLAAAAAVYGLPVEKRR